jgi:DNA-binding LacI/PurR family transcriptional regulator
MINPDYKEKLICFRNFYKNFQDIQNICFDNKANIKIQNMQSRKEMFEKLLNKKVKSISSSIKYYYSHISFKIKQNTWYAVVFIRNKVNQSYITFLDINNEIEDYFACSENQLFLFNSNYLCEIKNEHTCLIEIIEINI